MELIADGVLILAATVAGVYCLVLSRRLHSLTQMESGLGKAITGMSTQIDEMEEALARAKSSTEESAKALSDKLIAAEEVVKRLEELLEEAKQRQQTGDGPPTAAPPKAERAEMKLNRTPRKPAAEEDEATGRKRLDGLISSYLNEFEGEDEAAIARRLVAVLTSADPADANTTAKEHAV